MPILVGIDGTGGGSLPTAARDFRYKQEFTDNSFVSKLCEDKLPNAQYNRGPVTLGGGLNEAIINGLRFIEERRRALGASEPILLTGYSRGALGVLVIAQRLKWQNINVRAALLFDAVDRHAGYNSAVVPNNIEHVMHLIRHPAAKSRHSFGNAAMDYIAPTKYEKKMFMCTHGGMGGTPWKRPPDKKPSDLIDEGVFEELFLNRRTLKELFLNLTTAISYEKDEEVSDQVWKSCQEFISTHGFNI